MSKDKDDEQMSYTFSPDDPIPEEESPASKGNDAASNDEFSASQEKPLFSTLIPNLGTGLVTLSKGASSPAAAPVTLPPPKRSLPKAEKVRISTEKNAAGQSVHGDEMPPPPSSRKNGKKERGQKKDKFVKDEGAAPAEYVGEFEEELIGPAYEDVTPDKPTARPRLNRPHLLNADTEVLVQLAEEFNILLKDYPTAGALVSAIMEANDQRDGTDDLPIYGEGVLEIGRDGYGYLRAADLNYQESPEDIYLAPVIIKRYSLRIGDCVMGSIKKPRANDPRSAMVKIIAVNGRLLSERHGLHSFETLTPYYPTKRLLMERGKEELTMRVADLVTPIGRGQRGLIVAQPRTGKTIILQKLANSILENNDDVTLIVLLIDERPEEVTDMKRLVDAEIVASTFDEPPEHHAQLCDLVSERAKRLVENGKHVVILLDSITRLARAYNTLAPKSGRILSGGLDANALHKPKRFFGSARNIEGGGSLTILATALIDTGSRMDELIFEEFKGTGNMELHLDRQLADRRIFPAIDITKSGTRREELLVSPEELDILWGLRKGLCSIGDPANAMERLIINLRKFGSNLEFLAALRQKSNKGE